MSLSNARKKALGVWGVAVVKSGFNSDNDHEVWESAAA